MKLVRRSDFFLLPLVCCLIATSSFAQEIRKGELLYDNSLLVEESMADWRMEGLGKLEFDSTGMHMFSEGQSGHHVVWCPEEFPNSFIVEWEVKNENREAGLCIVFFASKGIAGQSIFDASVQKRNGKFGQYIKGDIDNYHISYHANSPTQKNRPFSHLRKNTGFHKVHVGKAGIQASSEEWHRIRLVKNGGHIRMLLDDVTIVDWQDDGIIHGPVLGAGHIGFRQMKWTRFCYRNFKVWAID
jgi:hypothetical protein